MTLESAEGTPREEAAGRVAGELGEPPAASEGGQPVWVEPDLDFIRALNRQGGDSLKKCFQCGTCSATCSLSPDSEPFPRKEMAWAAWGMKDRLLRDPDVWLCYQCNDCSTICPRGGRPGDVLAAVRQECVLHYAVPRFLGRWVGQPQCDPAAAGHSGRAARRWPSCCEARSRTRWESRRKFNSARAIVYPYSSMFPHWLLNSFFGFFSLLVLLSVAVGRGALLAGHEGWRRAADGTTAPAKGLLPSILAVAEEHLHARQVRHL